MPSEPHEMDRISFTADGIAARRTIMDIPHSQEIYNVLLEKVTGTEDEAVLKEALEAEKLFAVPFFESRYRLLDKLMKATCAKKVIEIAAGLTPRGINWTEDSDVNYVEFDLPRKSEQKREMVEILTAQSNIKMRPNLHFVGGDATSYDDLSKAISYFGETGPIVIANEGLLRYLTFDQKRILAKNIHYLLEHFGGYWITPDINIPDTILHDRCFKGHTRIKMDIEANLFESIVAAKTFFEFLGFEVAEHSFREVIPELASPKYFNMPADELEKLIGWRVAFVMKPK